MGGDSPGNNSVPSVYVYNSNSSSSAANSIVTIRTNRSNGGKPYVSFDANVIDRYLNLKPVTYLWNKGNSSDDKLQYGLIAQDVEKVFPEIVHTASDSLGTMSVNYQALHALSIKVIQSQQIEINSLKKKQADLEAMLLRIEERFR